MSVMYRRMSFLGSFWALAFLSCIAFTDAGAAPTFGYSIIPAPTSAPGQVVASPTPVSASSSYGAAVSGGNIALSAMTGAGYGLLNGASHATLNLPEYSFGASGFAQTSANFGMDNIVISGPPGEVVTYSVNGSVSGGIGASMSGTGSTYSGASVTLKFSTGSSFGGFGNAPLGSMSVDGGGGVSRTGVFAGFPVESMSNSAWTSPTWQARAGDTISVGMVLETSAAVDHRFGGTGFMDAFADFSRTVMFSTTGPVFNLPPGWTANSSDGSIINNTYVPEPAAATLAVVSGLVLLRRSARKA